MVDHCDGCSVKFDPVGLIDCQRCGHPYCMDCHESHTLAVCESLFQPTDIDHHWGVD